MRLVAALLLSLIPAPTELAPRLWAGATPGTHAVGFSTSIERDPTRQLDGAPRPIQVACWYPAVAGSGAPQTFRDYFVARASERAPATAAAENETIEQAKQFFASVGVPDALVTRWLAEPVHARAGASPVRGPFPLVLVAQGNGHSAGDQAILSEYLASHGFIVCTTPSQSRLGVTMTSEADVLPSALAQSRDLAIAERDARAHFAVRPGAALLVAHSFGARSALLYAAQHGAGALVSLDGGIGAAEARTWIDNAPIDRARVTTPILHIYEEGDRAITPNMELMRSLTASDRTLVKIDDVRHIDFSSLGFASAAIDGLTGKPPSALAEKCRAIATLTLQFLDAHADRGAASQRTSASAAWMHVERLPPAK